MSTRTIIEINHDFLKDLCDKPNELSAFLHSFAYASLSELQDTHPQGFRVLAQRHHSDKITIDVS